MTAREYLGQAQKLMRQAEAKTEQLIRLRALAERTTAAYGMDAGGGSGTADRRAEIVARIVDMEKDLTAQNAELLRAWNEIAGRIGQMPEETHRTLLQLRYLCGESFVRIGEKMGYCERQVRRLHGQALRAFERRMNRTA